jgi:hypothetical protein
MLREAELFVMAEEMLVEVLGRIRDEDRDIVLPPRWEAPGADQAAPLRQVVEQYARDEASVPGALSGRTPDDIPRGAPGDGLPSHDRQAAVVRLAAAACAAARAATDGDAVVRTGDGDLSVRTYLQRLTVTRSLVAHYVAAYLGSTACPLPEELARPLWEATHPEADAWRALGIFRAPLPLPDHVSWRDRFLLSAGHQPHPLGH